MTSQTNDRKSLTDIVKENISLFSSISVFAAMGGFFLSRIDTNYSIVTNIASARNLFYLIISNFSYLIVIILSFEFLKNLASIKKLNFESVLFIFSIILIVISIGFLYFLSDLEIFFKIYT